MNLNAEQKYAEFRKACEPLVKWLNENCHPHVKVIVEPTGAELVEGQKSVSIEEFIKD